MKAAIIAAFVASVFVAGCSCDCEKQQGAAVPAEDGKSVTEEINADTATQRETTATGNTGSTRTTRSPGQNSDQQRVGSGQQGVGNVDTETGTNPYEQSSSATPATTQKPKKPGITGTYRTRASGTGTSSGRQVN